jgi:hypothetical protein
MEFYIIKNGERIYHSSHQLIFWYCFTEDYPKIVKNDNTYTVWISQDAYLEETYDTYDSTDSMCIYLKGLEYNIRGLWNAGG